MKTLWKASGPGSVPHTFVANMGSGVLIRTANPYPTGDESWLFFPGEGWWEYPPRGGPITDEHAARLIREERVIRQLDAALEELERDEAVAIARALHLLS